MRSKVLDRILKNTPKEVEIFVDLYADLVVKINQILKEKGITKKDLADKMDKQPSEISKWLGGDHNFTLKSLAKLSAELGEDLIMVKPSSKSYNFVDGEVRTVHTFVTYRQKKRIDHHCEIRHININQGEEVSHVS